MTNPDQMRAEVEYSDAAMLLDYLRTRKSQDPLSMREILEAVHRHQGTELNRWDVEHMKTVINRLALAGYEVTIDRVPPSVNIDDAYAELERLPLVPTYRITKR